jgi:sterol desaturase/sphingolipid hydroxylase (fatty acid hydroxylase superfamily)
VVGTVGVSGSGSFAVLDAAGRAVVVTSAALWPAAEIPRLAKAAGLPFEMRGQDGQRQVLGLRKDGVRLGSRSSTPSAAAAAVLAALVLAAIVAARVGVAPFWVVVVLFLALLATLGGPMRRRL